MKELRVLIENCVQAPGMCRTTLNVAGDITAATYVARSEGYELSKSHVPELERRGVVAGGPSSREVID